MKRGLFLLTIIFLILIPFLNSERTIIENGITGEAVTGKITNANLGITIGVNIEQPNINLILPKNKTYIANKNLLLYFSETNTFRIWYNIDNGINITITGNTTFNTTSGGHTLYLYSNNTDGNETSDKVTFTVDESEFKIYYNKFAGSKKGTSTNFNESAYEDLEDLSDIILEDTTYGKIIFKESINLINDENIGDNLLDLDRNINISNNRIELNSTALPNFNKQATLWFYNSTLDNPRILKDGVVCSSPNCVIESYSGGTLKFNVTGFSVYSAEETPAGDSGQQTSGGGGSRTTIKKLEIDRENIQISLKQGETKEVVFTLKNLGTNSLNINIEKSNLLKNFIKLDETSFILKAGESKTIKSDFLAKENAIPDLYIGKLMIKGGEIEKEILVTIEVESKNPLFDVKAEIPNKFKYIFPGEETFVKIELYNLGDFGRVDVSLDYIIKDEKNNEIVKEHETIAVETKISFIKTFHIPKEIEFGKYIFYVKATYNGKVASATSWFKVGKKPFSKKEITLYAFLVILVITILIIFYEIRKIKKHVKKHIKISSKKT